MLHTIQWKQLVEILEISLLFCRLGRRCRCVCTCAADGALAVERGHSVVTRGAVMASGAGAVVDIVAAVVPGPAVHAHALVAAVGVVARAAILAGVGHQLALVDVIPAKLTCWGEGG